MRSQLSIGLGDLGVVGGVYPSTSQFHPSVVPPNAYALCLEQEKQLFTQLNLLGGVSHVCSPSKYAYAKPPYLVMPAQGRQYTEIATIALPPAGSGDTVVLSFQVPAGYDGVITSITNFYEGGDTPLIEGSGDLYWRLKVGNKWARDLGNIDTTLGSLTTPCPFFRGGIRIYSHQTITYYVDLPALSPLANGLITCGVFGWYYPI